MTCNHGRETGIDVATSLRIADNLTIAVAACMNRRITTIFQGHVFARIVLIMHRVSAVAHIALAAGSIEPPAYCFCAVFSQLASRRFLQALISASRDDLHVADATPFFSSTRTCSSCSATS